MELKLSQNIKARRKKCGFTQEQLAEAMGVSVGTVSKWESGNSYPDIEMVAALADFFQESVDALLGYQWKQSSAGQTVRRLKALRGERRYDEGLAEVKTALQKFPYQSDVLYECGELLFQSSIAQTHPAACGANSRKSPRKTKPGSGTGQIQKEHRRRPCPVMVRAGQRQFPAWNFSDWRLARRSRQRRDSRNINRFCKPLRAVGKSHPLPA